MEKLTQKGFLTKTFQLGPVEISECYTGYLDLLFINVMEMELSKKPKIRKFVFIFFTVHAKSSARCCKLKFDKFYIH